MRFFTVTIKSGLTDTTMVECIISKAVRLCMVLSSFLHSHSSTRKNFVFILASLTAWIISYLLKYGSSHCCGLQGHLLLFLAFRQNVCKKQQAYSGLWSIVTDVQKYYNLEEKEKAKTKIN